MNRNTTLIATLLAACSLTAHAGPTAPPAGPAVSTMKTLDQVEPRVMLSAETTPGNASTHFIINSPGSYYLGSSYLNDAYTVCIQVNVSDVTIDLNGFHIRGGALSQSAIRLTTGLENVTIRNGTISNYTLSGVYAVDCTGMVVEDLVVNDAQGRGVYLGRDARVRNVTVNNSTNGAIFTGAGSTVSDSTISGSVNGFYSEGATSYINCTARDNAQYGFILASGGSMRDCLASGNASTAVYCVDQSLGVNIQDCTINVPNISGAHGIQVYWESTVKNNTIRMENSASVGIRSFMSGNVIEGNTSSGGGYAVRVSANKHNLVMGNFHTGTAITAFDIPTGNTSGPLVTTTGTLTTTSPFANFYMP